MKAIENWNLNDLIQKNPESKGWVLENFIREKANFKNGTLGIKWINEKKWFIKSWFSSQDDVRTFVILISGEMLIELTNTWEKIDLKEEWDYLYFSTSYSDHTTTMLKDTVATAVRWKEI